MQNTNVAVNSIYFNTVVNRTNLNATIPLGMNESIDTTVSSKTNLPLKGHVSLHTAINL